MRITEFYFYISRAIKSASNRFKDWKSARKKKSFQNHSDKEYSLGSVDLIIRANDTTA